MCMYVCMCVYGYIYICVCVCVCVCVFVCRETICSVNLLGVENACVIVVFLKTTPCPRPSRFTGPNVRVLDQLVMELFDAKGVAARCTAMPVWLLNFKT